MKITDCAIGGPVPLTNTVTLKELNKIIAEQILQWHLARWWALYLLALIVFLIFQEDFAIILKP